MKLRQLIHTIGLTIILFFTLSGHTIFFAQANNPKAQKGDAQLSKTLYSDPKGFFRIRAPEGWRVQDYPQDPRGKVGFHEPSNQATLRALTQVVDITDLSELIQHLRNMEKQVGSQMNIEPIIFNKMPAVKADAILTISGIASKYLWINFLLDGVQHNLQYSAEPKHFDKHYSIAWKSMLSYEPLKRKTPSSTEEARKHEAAKWIRLANISIEMGKTQAAKQAVAAGLEVDPQNTELKKLKSALNKK